MDHEYSLTGKIWTRCQGNVPQSQEVNGFCFSLEPVGGSSEYSIVPLDKVKVAALSDEEVANICRGLSLNDVHWVVADDFKGKWKDFNLYENEFSQAVALTAFNGMGSSIERLDWISSPEFSTNGMLAKCWRRIDGEVQLYKSGTDGGANTGFEPYSEYYAVQIAETMGLAHVDYGLSRFKGRLCSTCGLFTSDKIGYLPAGRIATPDEALSDSRFADILFFDALIFNTDRHLGNFGYLVDNDKNEIIGPAPIFDNGYGLFSLALDRPGEKKMIFQIFQNTLLA